MPSKEPEPLGPGGGPLHHMCDDARVTGVEHHAELASQPPRCRRHYALYQAHLAAERQRKARGSPLLGDAWDRGPDAPEDTGSLLLAPDEVGFLADTLKDVSTARLRMLENRNRPERHAEAVRALDEASRQLVDFFVDDLGIDETARRRV